MTSIRKQPSGRWHVQLGIKAGRKSKTFDTKAEAKRWAAVIEADTPAGDRVLDHKQLHDVFERYRDEVSVKKKGERWETIRLNKFCTYPLANLRLAKVTREDVESWINIRLTTGGRTGSGIEPSSVNRELNLMSHCFTQARRWRWMSHNPMGDLKRPKDPPPRDRRITADEIERILVAMNYSEDFPLTTQRQYAACAFLFAIETAMRAGEICCLDDARIDLEKRVATLRPGDTKTGFGRKVPLSREAIRLLGRLPSADPGKQLFHMVKSGTLSTLFKVGRQNADIHDMTFHDTRHEATTRLAGKLQVLDLARVTGHRDIKELMTYYNKSAEDLAGQLD